MSSNRLSTEATSLEPDASTEARRKGPLAYRLMRADGKYPELGDTASTLGVRVPKDISPNETGHVSPSGKHGLSVRPTIDAYMDEAASFVPRRYKKKDPVRFRNAAGSDKVSAFRLGTGRFAPVAVNDDLTLSPDRENHGVIEPAKRMTVADYRDAIARTRTEWHLDEP